ncbi:MAG: DUF3575 domain-containing protein [Chitinivibrionales bacterium]|nr:DUF3575 domain-containing protein [Chitinivibrionales bacterium]
MKKLSFLSIILIVGFTAVLASPQYDDLMKLVKSGASEEVIVAYINASDSSYNLSSDQVLQLKQSGATPKVIVAAIQHKGALVSKPNNLAAPPETAAMVESRPYVVYRVPAWRSWREVNRYWSERVTKMNQALQVDMAALMFGGIALNYEYLLHHEHGFVVAGSYYSGWDLDGENGALEYRWHWAQSMHSGFLGVFINGGRYHGNESDLPDNSNNSSGRYTQTSVTVGPDIGQRWVSAGGLSVVARIGYGYTWSKFDWDPASPIPDQNAIDQLRWNTGFDYELSLGYAF